MTKKHKDELGAKKVELEPTPADKDSLLAKHEELKLLTESREQRIKDLEDALKRMQAEFENAKKREDRFRQDLLANANASLVAKLLSAIDEFDIVLEKINDSGDKDGMMMVYTNLFGILKKEGLEEMECLGKQFDPLRHEAIRSDDGEDGKVLSVIKKGYLFKGNVLRHALVVVGKSDR